MYNNPITRETPSDSTTKMFSKVFVLCLALVAVDAGVLHGGLHTGASVGHRTQDGYGNYGFSYNIAGHGGTNSRSEVGDGHGNKRGAYSLTDADGRARVVEYVADGHGFRAAVKTNEPGTAASAPADAVINSPYAAPVAPAPLAHVAAAGHGLLGVHGPVAYGTNIVHGGYGGYGGYGGHGWGLGLGHGVGLNGLGLGHGVGLHGLGLGHGVGLHGLGLGHH